jgi:hypothetical protein
MALNRIIADSIADGTVVASDIADGTITLAKLQSGLLPSANANSGAFYANSAFAAANTAASNTIIASSYANSAFSYANSSFTKANNALTAGANTTTSVQFGSIGIGTAASGATGEIRATDNITAYYSDDRLKTRLGNIESALDKIRSLTGFYYEANQTAQDLGYRVKREVGVSAQEVQKVMPEIVVPAPIDDKYLTVHYDKLLPLVIESIKELANEFDEIKKTINR